MKQQYIDKIKKACIKANPEIMEIKFGCKILVNYDDVPNSLEEHIISRTFFSKDFIEVRACDNNVWYGEDWLNLKPEIIGRPIQLADVLLAIEFRNGKTRGTKDFNMWVFQKEFTFEDKDGFQCVWDLTKTLEEQEEKTLKFIAEII